MKKAISILPLFLFLCYCFFPFCKIIVWICGYDFILRSYPMCGVALAVISLTICIFLLAFKITLNKINIVFSALILPMSAINGIFYLSISLTKLTIFSILICCGCSIAIFTKFAGPIKIKIIFTVLSVLLILFLLFLSFIDFTFGGITCNTIVKTISSPQSTYIAEVIDSDQGALGGDTFVNIEYGKTIDLFIGKFSKLPVCVYTGDWGEYTDIKVEWKSEHVLIIDGKEHYISY